MAERSKALRQGRNLFGGVGSNPTLVTHVCTQNAPTVGIEPAISRVWGVRPNH